jgi:glycerate kinase
MAPLADGGPGTVDALVRALGGEYRTARVEDPLGRPVVARWGWLPDGTAVVEMAAASGLSLLPPSERDPRRASTFGTGQLLLAAMDAGARRLTVGLGGSATNDGGAGAAAALGARFLDAEGRTLPPGGAALARLRRIDLAGRTPRLAGVELVLATDVTNPLLGPRGASAVYGPQKGASPEVVEALDAALANLSRVVREQLGQDLADQPGMGAAGGLAYGLATFAGGRLTPGFPLIADVLGLERRIQRADLVLTAEGRFDGQTGQGKGPDALARLALTKGKRTVLFAGSVGPDVDPAKSLFHEVVTVGREELPLEELRRQAAALLESAVGAWAASRGR